MADDDWSVMIDDCQQRSEKLSDWEAGFIEDIDADLRRTGGLTGPQSDKLNEIWERVTG